MLSKYELLKIKILTYGINLTKKAKIKLTNNLTQNITNTISATNSGIILILPENIYVNAEYKNIENSPITLDFKNETFYLKYKNEKNNEEIKIEILPSLSFDNITAICADRIRISTISGCSFNCKYCNLNQNKYHINDFETIKKSINKILKYSNPKHALISGGTPKNEDILNVNDINFEIIKYLNSKNLPVDIMLSPQEDIQIIQKLKDSGTSGLAINLEIYNEKLAKEFNPAKANIGRENYFKFIEETIKIFGIGKVRSLLIIGLEPLEEMLKGIEELAKIGCDICLSPFIPAKNTMLKNKPRPTEDELISDYNETKKIIQKYNVKLGPRCIACQNNTLNFPKDVE